MALAIFFIILFLSETIYSWHVFWVFTSSVSRKSGSTRVVSWTGSREHIWDKQGSSLHHGYCFISCLLYVEVRWWPPHLSVHDTELAKSWWGRKKKKKSPPSPHSVSLSLPLCSTERLIRTCHRSNEYHLNCFVYGSEFGCWFNLRMCLSSCARRGGRTESGSPNEIGLGDRLTRPDPIRRLWKEILTGRRR